MKIKSVLVAMVCVLCGCATTQQPFNPAQFAQTVKDRSAFIEAGAAVIFNIVLYSSEQDATKRAEISAQVGVVAAQLNVLLSAGQVDPGAVTAALKVKEPWAAEVLAGVATLYRAEYDRARANGYAALATELLKAVTAGLADATGVKR